MKLNMKKARSRTTALLLGALICAMTPTHIRANGDAPPVTLKEDDASFLLSIGIVTARILKNNGDIRSMTYKGRELFTDRSGHAGGYWSHDTTGGADVVARVTIDPAANGGERAEVSVKGISGGIGMGHGPGAEADGDIPADIEIRYCIGRGESGVYTYCQFDHRPEYPADQMTEARFACKLAAMFDWISVDKYRNKYYPKTDPNEDKYVYTTVQSENRAFGFSSTTEKIGWWMINPSIEFLSGGPTKPEFFCHRDTTPVQAPVVLNYWRSSHYGGADVTVAEGERWTKVIGPIFLYVNEGGEPLELWREARDQADKETANWPYAWVAGVDYPTAGERSVVSGRLTLNDPLMPGGAKFDGNLLVGLAHPPYPVSAGNRGTRTIGWQTDAKHYQFWTEGGSDGGFNIPAVRPGNYTLYALADGVLGEFARADIAIPPGGKAVNLGELEWKPLRHGRQLWEVGVANRSGREFAGGDRFFEMDAPLKYATLFPSDVHYVIGESKPDKDWYFQHIPHNEDGNARIAPFRGVRGEGRATPYTIEFAMPEIPRGTATLRLAICGTGANALAVGVNGKPAGDVRLNFGDGVITRHQIQGIWYERELEFDASMLKQGRNTLSLTVPAGPLNNGVVYDYVRLELNEDKRTARASASPADEL
jgi:rhamnogalacturonan endolyase